MKNHPEADFQKLCVKYLIIQYPQCFFHHSPNEGRRTPQYWNWLKSLGTQSGMLDLTIFDARRGYNGLAVELKVGKGRLTENQKSVIEKFSQKGWHTVVCSTFEEFKSVVDQYYAKFTKT